MPDKKLENTPEISPMTLNYTPIFILAPNNTIFLSSAYRISNGIYSRIVDIHQYIENYELLIEMIIDIDIIENILSIDKNADSHFFIVTKTRSTPTNHSITFNESTNIQNIFPNNHLYIQDAFILVGRTGDHSFSFQEHSTEDLCEYLQSRSEILIRFFDPEKYFLEISTHPELTIDIVNYLSSIGSIEIRLKNIDPYTWINGSMDPLHIS